MDHAIRFPLCLVLLMAAGAVSGLACAADTTKGTVDRMYVLECGDSKTDPPRAVERDNFASNDRTFSFVSSSVGKKRHLYTSNAEPVGKY